MGEGRSGRRPGEYVGIPIAHVGNDVESTIVAGNHILSVAALILKVIAYWHSNPYISNLRRQAFFENLRDRKEIMCYYHYIIISSFIGFIKTRMGFPRKEW